MISEAREVGGESAGREVTPDLLDSPDAGPTAVRGGALRLSGYVGAALLALGSGAVLYRYLGPVKGGRYGTAGALVALVATGTDLGVSAVGMREMSVLTGEARERMARTLVGMRVTITAIGVALAAGFAFVAYGSTLGIGVLLAGIALVIQVWQGTMTIAIAVELRFGWLSLLGFLQQFLISSLIVALVIGGAGLLPFVASPLPASIVILALTVAVFRRRVTKGASFVMGEWRALAKPVLSYAAASAASALYFRVAILLVSLLSTGDQLGYFTLSFNAMAALFVIPGTIVAVAFPIFSRAARDDQGRLAYAIERVFEVCLIVGAWGTLAIALSAHFAIEVIGGAKFAPAADVLAIQGIAVGAAFVGTVWGFGLLSLERYRAILLFNIVALSAVVIAVSILATVDGARGAAIGTSAVEVANAIIGAGILMHGRSHLRPSLRVVPKVFLAAAIAATPALIAVSEPARVALSAVIYLVVLLTLRALPSELIALLPSRKIRPSG